ncbi:MAG: phosphoenolpyruvate synthase [Candidatus Woesearchaeota archaeon]|nr:phosphoenolpyruvate synthase [Candidatus Woesearchaeota archaeon]
MNNNKEFILWFSELGIKDVPLVGGKNASLGEMYQNLTKKGVIVPNGFAVTAYAYRYLLEKTKIKNKIKEILSDLDTTNMKNLSERGQKVRELIKNAEFPDELKEAIKSAYKKLAVQYSLNVDVAVRSSATAEDLPDASFAGQQETYLNIKGESQLIDSCKKCFASLFTNRAISYRVDKGFDHFKIALSIGVQKMVRSDLASAGVMFSIDTESGFEDVVLINGAYGLGENVVQGAVNPDEFYIHKPTLKKGFKPILSKTMGAKKIKMIYSNEGSKTTTKNIPVNQEDRNKFVISDDEILKLAKWAAIIEDHYQKPMDMEWAKDGETNKLFIVQARPETVQSQKNKNILETYKIQKKGQMIVTGRSVGERIGQGKATILKDAHHIHKFKKGEVLVADMTDPDWEPIMKIASAIVTNRGGRTCFTGETRVLTDKGFMTFEEIYSLDDYNKLKVPSLNKSTLKIEWKPVLAIMKKKSKVIKVTISQTGKAENNCLKLTPDHKMINIRNSEIVDTRIDEILSANECISAAQLIPRLTAPTEKDKKLAYLLGAISTDGHIYTSRTHGEVTFIQKPTSEKQRFISKVTNIFSELYNKDAKVQNKKPSSGFIRGEKVVGSANAYRVYSKQIAYDLKKEQESLVQTILTADEEVIYNFLGGVIDGDGTFNKKSNRINIFISKEYLAQSVIIGCLRLGFLPQVTNNRNIYNIQIVEKINELTKYTQRVKGVSDRKIMATRFFNTRQLFDNQNYGSGINKRRKSNLLISDRDVVKETRFDKNLKQKLQKLIESDIKQLRVNKQENIEEVDVFNITVADNHNYTVFTEQYTPVLVNNCHAAIISRELGIPCIVGTNNGTQKIKQGELVTVSCAEGEEGHVYKGNIPFKITKTNIKKIPRPKTKIMMNIATPEQAFEFSFIPNDGVGLTREEFIINEYIKIHPKALINYNKLKDKAAKVQIDKLTKGYKNKTNFFVEKLSHGIATIAAAFYPKPVILRFSDFKSNEYANLIGGREFEPKEDNPMIGWRGASRYYTDYKDGFALECKAIKKVREEMGLTNLVLMIPFCRTIEEGKSVLKEMEKNGLKRHQNGLEVYVMCEIPSNIILADEFSKIFDGFSIGSNDLTQLTLGLDRDSELVSHIYDERNLAVKKLIALVIHKAKKNHSKIGICGQAPSDFEDFARFLVQQGIDSISLNPDTVIKTTLSILEEEKKLKKNK